jgi:excisionase family DNA binding protein
MTDHDHDFLTITEAAALLRTPVATLRYWRHLGTGPRSFRIGRRVLYRLSDLEGWIKQQQDDDLASRRPIVDESQRAG